MSMSINFATEKCFLHPSVLKFLVDQMPTKMYDRAARLLSKFSYPGQVALTEVLLFAKESGQITKALDILERHWDRGYHLQRADLRGDPRISINLVFLSSALGQIAPVSHWKILEKPCSN